MLYWRGLRRIQCLKRPYKFECVYYKRELKIKRPAVISKRKFPDGNAGCAGRILPRRTSVNACLSCKEPVPQQTCPYPGFRGGLY